MMTCTMTDQLIDRLSARVNRETAAGKPGLAKKWETEMVKLTSPAYVAALETAKFDPASIDKMAIYVAQKVRRLAAHFVGAGTIDPYTATLLTNMRHLAAQAKIMDGRAMRASLTARVTTMTELATHRSGTDGTASTQASSTRQALLALNAATASKAGFEVDFSHPFVAKAVGA